MTEELFRNNSYVKIADATVTAVEEDGVVLSRSVFYPKGGGQDGDKGIFRTSDGGEIVIVNTIKDQNSGVQKHIPADGMLNLAVGDSISM